MKRLFSLFAIAFILGFTASTVHAQNADAVIDQYLKKTGGIANWKKIKSTKTTANMVMQDMASPLVMWQKNPDKQKIEMELQGQKFVQAFDGKEGWMINPFESNAARKLSGEELKEMEDQLSTESPLIDYKTKGHKAELEGTETIDGVVYNKVKLTKKNGSVNYFLFHKDNSIPVILRRTVIGGPMAGQVAETHTKEYKQTGDVMLPYISETKLGGQTFITMKVDKYEQNIAIDDSIFEFPTK